MMKIMPNLELADEDVDFLFNDNRRFDYGGESIICRGIKKNTAYKIFFDRDDNELLMMSDNKFEKIKRQYQHPLEHSIKPLRTITLLGELIGYEMTYDPNDISLLDSIITKEEMIRCLKETKKILEYYHSKDIIYGDVKDDNILINSVTGKISFCDMDNIYMQELPIDVMGQELSDFFDEHQADVIADHYMHNLLTLYKTINKEKMKPKSYYEIAAMIREESISIPELYDEDAKCLIKKMEKLSQYDGGYLIDYIKKEI